ncbi:hypothetical protein [Photobacterium ganghwense]|uniref:hypothetical protein n=1 Tax=Photobacterium ganghwense TaxID=320778 RepID=UPI001A90859F|nr:hypothetical protein [Photobacterium ganghwense]QSV17584.1 hypothetical protein FH974_26135 [Photobacterium ganghwense]
MWGKLVKVFNYLTGEDPNLDPKDSFLQRCQDIFDERIKGIPEAAKQKAELLQRDLYSQIKYMSLFKVFHRKRYLWYQRLSIIASFFATISIAISGVLVSGKTLFFMGSVKWNIIAIVASALVTTIALLAKTSNNRSLWQANTDYCHQFCSLYIELNEKLSEIIEVEDSPTKDEDAAKEIQQLRTKIRTIDTNFRNALRKVTVHQQRIDTKNVTIRTGSHFAY